MSYATDGFCHNAQPGTYGHECGKPATWIGATSSGFRSGYCAACKADGYEAKLCVSWAPIDPPAGYAAEYRSGESVLLYGYGDTANVALRDGLAQIAGAPGEMYSTMRRRIFVKALTAEEASDVCEMLATPW